MAAHWSLRRAKRGVLKRAQVHYGVFVAGNNRDIWRTSETYSNKDDVVNAINLVRAEAPSALIVDEAEPHWSPEEPDRP